MSIGQRAKLTCSPDYAYGDGGYPGVYPLYSLCQKQLKIITIN